MRAPLSGWRSPHSGNRSMRWPHRIVVSLGGGEQVTLRSEYPPQADAPLTRSKFRALAQPIIGPAAADEVIGLVDRLESLPNPKGLMSLLQQRFLVKDRARPR
jgi:hypothetical protein